MQVKMNIICKEEEYTEIEWDGCLRLNHAIPEFIEKNTLTEEQEIEIYKRTYPEATIQELKAEIGLSEYNELFANAEGIEYTFDGYRDEPLVIEQPISVENVGVTNTFTTTATVIGV